MFGAIVTVILPLLLVGCSTETREGSSLAIFDSQEEAMKAAKNFQCTGAHKMGDKWMPCSSHEIHEGDKTHNGHSHHPNH